MDALIKYDIDFLSNLVKILLVEKIKWSPNIFKLFAYDLKSQKCLKSSSAMDSEITFLHACCTTRDLKVILIDLDDNFNCTIIGQLEPFTATLFHQAPPMILLRRVIKY